MFSWVMGSVKSARISSTFCSSAAGFRRWTEFARTSNDVSRDERRQIILAARPKAWMCDHHARLVRELVFPQLEEHGVQRKPEVVDLKGHGENANDLARKNLGGDIRRSAPRRSPSGGDCWCSRKPPRDEPSHRSTHAQGHIAAVECSAAEDRPEESHAQNRENNRDVGNSCRDYCGEEPARPECRSLSKHTRRSS